MSGRELGTETSLRNGRKSLLISPGTSPSHRLGPSAIIVEGILQVPETVHQLGVAPIEVIRECHPSVRADSIWRTIFFVKFPPGCVGSRILPEYRVEISVIDLRVLLDRTSVRLFQIRSPMFSSGRLTQSL